MGDSATVDAGQEQHLQALEYANRVRLARAQMKRKVATGELSAGEIILDSPWQANSMSISDLLMSQKRWGRTRCRRLLVSLSVPENKQVGTLTVRQREALAAMLAARNALTGPHTNAAAAGAIAPAAVRQPPTGLRPSSSSVSSAVSPGPAVASSMMCPSGSRR